MKRLKNKTLPLWTLRRLFEHDPASDCLVWKISITSRAQKGQLAGCPDAKGYWRVRYRGTYYSVHRLLWKLVNGHDAPTGIDHRNLKQGDNRYSNLRLATQAENSRNTRLSKDNTSGFKGVSYDRRRKKWRASIVLNRRQYFCGYYKTKKAAAAAYDARAKELHGAFASINQKESV